jgi:hypothetical protein
MGMMMPETCWAASKRQVINLKSCYILLVDSVESMKMHGLANPKPIRTKKYNTKINLQDKDKQCTGLIRPSRNGYQWWNILYKTTRFQFPNSSGIGVIAESWSAICILGQTVANVSKASSASIFQGQTWCKILGTLSQSVSQSDRT